MLPVAADPSGSPHLGSVDCAPIARVDASVINADGVNADGVDTVVPVVVPIRNAATSMHASNAVTPGHAGATARATVPKLTTRDQKHTLRCWSVRVGQSRAAFPMGAAPVHILDS